MEIQFFQILFQIINFSVVLGVVTFLLYKPIQKILDERAKRIKAGQEAADQAIIEKEEINKQKSQNTKDAEKTASDLLEAAKKQALTQKKEILAATKKEAEAERQKMLDSWQQEKTNLKKQYQQQMIEAVITTTEKVIAKKMTSKIDQELIDRELDSILAKI